jgi:hypothetical protein
VHSQCMIQDLEAFTYVFLVGLSDYMLGKLLHVHPIAFAVDERWVHGTSRAGLVALAKIYIHVEVQLLQPPGI